MLLFSSLMGLGAVLLVLVLVGVTLNTAGARDKARARGARRDPLPTAEPGSKASSNLPAE